MVSFKIMDYPYFPTEKLKNLPYNLTSTNISSNKLPSNAKWDL